MRSWETKPLEELCEFRNGLWKGKKPPYTEVGIIRNTNFTSEGFLDDSDIAYHPVEVKQYEKRKLEFGDIILEKSGGGPRQPVGRVIPFEKADGEFSFSNFTSVIRIKDKEELDYEFLHRLLYHYYVSGVTEPMQRRSTGIRNLDFKAYKQLPVPMPEVAEQKRIVSILDEAFSAITKAKENAEKNLANAREIYSSILDQAFAKISLEGKIVELRELIQHLGDYHSNGSYKILKANVELKTEEDYAWMVRSTDFEKGFRNSFRYASKAAYDFLAKSRIDGGEIIMSKIGNAGKVYLMPPISRPCSLAMNLFLLRLDKSVATHEYTYRYLKSSFGDSQIKSKLRGAATQTITKESVRELMIPLVSKAQQDDVVRKLERIESETDRLETIYTQKLANLDELKQSLLQKAFTSQLTETPALQEVAV